MNTTMLFGIATVLVVLLIIIGGMLLLVAKLFHKVEQGKALIVSTMRNVEVTFVGRVVIPVIHRAETMDISVKTIEIDRRGREGLICQDNIRADIRVTFFVRVNKTKEDVIKVAQSIGCVRASDQATLEELFAAKFSEALKTVGKQLDFVDLYTKRNEFRDWIIQVIGTDLNGYVLEDAAIDFLEQTPMSSLDENNILDAQGIRKITELTAIEHVKTNHFRREEEKEIKRKDVEAREALLELERQEADATSRQAREVSSVQAREWAETERIKNEERLKAESARIRTEQQIGIDSENQAREIAVAEKNRERVIAVETERVERDRELEVIAREREAELQRIAAEKDVEIQRKDIAEVVRERIAVDRTVAEQEEAIKKLRTVEEAERERQATIILAEAQAQELLVKDIKAAEAGEQSAHHKARERLTMAEAELQASDLEAKAKARLAEGVQAETAAPGLAEVQVREREADAVEKLGFAEARIKEADAVATEKLGLAEARVLSETGKAQGDATRDKLLGEAAGLTEKAEAMAQLDDATRGHEEFRLRIEALKEVQLSEIDARRAVAEAQAEVIGDGLRGADIDIVGGDTMFFDRIAGAIAYGKAVDGFVGHSSTAQAFLGTGNGEGSDVLDRVKGLVGSLSSDDIQNLTVSALLVRLIAASGGDRSDGLRALLDQARQLGVDSLNLSELGQAQKA